MKTKMTGSAFDNLRIKNPVVSKIMKAGGTAEDCAVALSLVNDNLLERVMLLEGIAPRRIRMPDGQVMVWRCPDDLVPETDLSKYPYDGCLKKINKILFDIHNRK